MQSGTRTTLWLVAAAVIVVASIPVLLMVVFLALLRLGSSSVDDARSAYYHHAEGPEQPAALAPVEELARKLRAETRELPVRRLVVRIAADEEYRDDAGAGWRTEVVERVARASGVLEDVCRVKLDVLEVREWESDDTAPHIHALHRRLHREMVDDAADIVIAFVRQHSPVGARPDTYDRGVAYYFGRSCIVRTGMPRRRGKAWLYEHETLLHELGHLFGSFHSRDWRSVMRPDKLAAVADAYDVQARATLLLMRSYDFAGGPESIAEETVEELLEIFRTDRFRGTVHPLAWAYASRGVRRADDGDVQGALRDRMRARSILQRLGTSARPADLARLDQLAAEQEAAGREARPR